MIFYASVIHTILVNNLEQTSTLLKSLSFIINYENFILELTNRKPKHTFEFLNRFKVGSQIKIRDFTMVVPKWSTQPWYPLFTSLMKEPVLYFKLSQELLISPCKSLSHPLAKNLTLVAARLSRKSS